MCCLRFRHRPHQASDGGVVGEDADHAGATQDLIVDALQQVGALDLARVELPKAIKRQHVLPGHKRRFSGLGEALGH